MTWTYVDPSRYERDAVRFEVGDTFSKKQIVTDEEIEYALVKEGSVLGAAARVCESLAAKYAREEITRTAAFTTDKTSISKKYLAMATRLRKRATGAGSFILPSGNVTEKENNETDSDIVQPLFKRGIFKNPDTQEAEID